MSNPINNSRGTIDTIEFASTGDLVDHKGRPSLAVMSMEDKVDEIALTMRALYDALDELGTNPMIAALMPGGKLLNKLR